MKETTFCYFDTLWNTLPKKAPAVARIGNMLRPFEEVKARA